ncbi:MAG: glycosyltransferase family 4 protein [Candidatus Magasanikbacteria bacterium]|nr:glycosyltransferase family 4 protein [Candidatus Magasanikbacteria bacterium]
MRIAHVVATFPPHVGGMGRVAYDEAYGLSRRGHDVTVFTLAYWGAHYCSDNLPFRVVRLWPLFQLGDAGFIPQLLWRLRHFDLVHFHYPWYGAGDMVWWASLLWQERYVVTYHMDAVPSGAIKRMLQALYDAMWPRFIFGRAERICIVDQAHYVEARFGRRASKKIVLLPNAVDTTIFKPTEEKKSNGQQIVFVGNLLPVKRLDLLLQALVTVPSAELAVVGGGYAEKDYRRQAEKLGVNARVRWIGVCSDPALLAGYYRAADVAVVPSERESFSLAVLEALASGLPVIASDFTGVAERVENGKNGFLFASGCSDDLAEKLKIFFALTREERQAMGEAARAKALEYSLDIHLNMLEKVYQQVNNVAI